MFSTQFSQWTATWRRDSTSTFSLATVLEIREKQIRIQLPVDSQNSLAKYQHDKWYKESPATFRIFSISSLRLASRLCHLAAMPVRFNHRAWWLPNHKRACRPQIKSNYSKRGISIFKASGFPWALWTLVEETMALAAPTWKTIIF